MPEILNKDENNKFEDESQGVVKNLTLKEFESFLNDYKERLTSFCKVDPVNSWNFVSSPLSIKLQTEENTEVNDLMVSESATFNKITATLCELCLQMKQLTKYARDSLFDPIIFYGESDEKEDEQMQLSRFLPFFRDVESYVKKCTAVTRNLIQQLSIIYCNENSPVKAFDFTSSKFTEIYETMGGLLATLAYLDHLVLNQANLKEHWKLYKRMLKNIRTSPQTFSMSEDQVESFVDNIESLESVVMASRMLNQVLSARCDEEENGVYVSRNKIFNEEFLNATKSLMTAFEARTSSVGELEWGESENLVGIICLGVLHQSIFQQASLDKKFIKCLWESHKKFPVVLVGGMISMYPVELLTLHIPHLTTPIVTIKGLQNFDTYKATWLNKTVTNIESWTSGMNDAVTAWLIEMDLCTTLTHCNTLPTAKVNHLFNVLLQGLSLAGRTTNYVGAMLNMHASLNIPLNKSSVLFLCRLIENVKMIQSCLFRHSIPVHKLLHFASHLASIELTRLLLGIQEKQRGSNKKASKQAVSALQVFTQALNGPVCQARIVIMKLIADVLLKQKSVREDEYQKITTHINHLAVINKYDDIILESSDCVFLYFHKVLITTYLSNMLQNPLLFSRLQFFLSALGDVSGHLAHTHHTDNKSIIVNNYEKFIINLVSETFLDGVCGLVETELRLDSHHHLQLSSRNPFVTDSSKKLDLFLHGPPIKIFDKYISVKRYVEAYLNKTFYNLTTVALHDWKTYTEMRVRAATKFQLTLIDPHLPSQTLEQGSDILEIMRNIHVFVSKYLYNLNNQIFVEKSSNNKHLNTITISHVANSIRTHGSGISNTTVNFTYQFLKKKFFVFSQFLYDEHIKSKLIKDVRYFKENQEALNFKYPYERAERFNKGIRKLGLNADGLSYLDQFRTLVSHIGNAMGYIRLIRSGGQHCCGNSIRFVNIIDEVGEKFEKLCSENSLSTECVRAAKHLDDVINDLNRTFAEGTDYFKVLVDVFASEFQDVKNIHLKNFYIILPPLTLNYVEYIISNKEKLNKKNKIDAAFTDDGFAMGVAYIFKLLNQYHNFDSLHWFQSVKDKLLNDKTDIKKQADKEDEKLMQTMALTLKRVQNLQKEFNLLYFSLSSARIFFRATQESKEQVTESIKEEVLSTAAPS